MNTITNSTNVALANFVNILDENGSYKARFAGLVTRKKGRVRGGKRYGDDLVHVVILTGFSYRNLVERSLYTLNDLAASVGFFPALAGKGYKDGKGNPVTEADFRAAYAELVDSFNKTLNGTNKSTTDHVYETLEVDGQKLEGCRVYTGDGEGDPGSIYVQGLKIGQTVIDPAPNGPGPKTKSRAKTVAKRILRSKLPVSRYVSYSLPKGGDYILTAGGEAFDAAIEAGVAATNINPNAVLSL